MNDAEDYISTSDMKCGDLIIREHEEGRSLFFIYDLIKSPWNNKLVLCNMYHFETDATVPTEVYLNERNELYPDKKRLLSRVAEND